MTWKLFIDDERFPIDENQVIARSVNEAIALMETNGCPIEINFDHDLGFNVNSGFDLVKWMVEKDLDENQTFIPSEFKFYVHSQNPVGAKNIESYLLNYLEVYPR